MRRTLKLTLLGALIIAPAAGAMAQQPAPTVSANQGRPPMEQRATRGDTEPLFTIFGLPVRIGGPVVRPYCSNCAVQNFGGQPMRGADAVARAAGAGPGAE